MKLKVKEKPYGITELYDTVATEIGHEDTSELNYDCRNINVARNIQNSFFDHYREVNPNMPESDFNMSMGMMLINYGPKVDENLQDNEVEVFDGFIIERK